jgi:hypothetical protein
MKRILLAMICLSLLCAGCLEQKKSDGQQTAKVTGSNTEKLIVTISSPKSGEILQGNKDVSFDAAINGGKGPYTYRWTSNIDGEISTSRSFKQNPSKLSKGHQVIILTVTDASGTSGHGSVSIEVM